ncbi:MAG: hypothetical protein ACK46Q_01235 [Hyphomonas sp.]
MERTVDTADGMAGVAALTVGIEAGTVRSVLGGVAAPGFRLGLSGLAAIEVPERRKEIAIKTAEIRIMDGLT